MTADVTALTRVTVRGPDRAVDMVLPGDEPVGALLGQLVEIAHPDIPDTPHEYCLVLPDGDVLGSADTFASRGVPDGTPIRLVARLEAPPPPVVHDVGAAMEHATSRLRWSWGVRARGWLLIGVACAVLGWALWTVRAVIGPAWMYGIGVGAGVVAVAVTRRVRTQLRVLLLGAGVVTCAVAIGSGGLAWPSARLTGLLAAAVFGVALVAVLGHGRAAAAAAISCIVAAAARYLLAAVGASALLTACLCALGSVLAVGMLPRLALAWAGLTRIDDQRADGSQVSVVSVDRGISDAHAVLALALVPLAALAAWAGALLIGEESVWGALLATVMAAVLLLRQRAFPLLLQWLTLTAAGGYLLLLAANRIVAAYDLLWVPPTAAAVALAVAVAGIYVTPGAAARARARQVVDRVEQIGVLCLFPLAFAALDVYDRLLHQSG